MMSQSPPAEPNSHTLFFAGDGVRLAAQIDYPTSPMPPAGYPVLFVIQHATCNTRTEYQHIARMGTEQGLAVFRWDKRGTGHSGAGVGSITTDALNAYRTALAQTRVDRTRAVIFAQNEGTSLLGEKWEAFERIQKPIGVILAGNTLDERSIVSISAPLHIVMSKNDWNAWQIYAEAASKAHQRKHNYKASFYVAPNTNRRLMYENGGSFHRGANDSMKEWLKTVCEILPLT
jgi:hypothetical protein